MEYKILYGELTGEIEPKHKEEPPTFLFRLHYEIPTYRTNLYGNVVGQGLEKRDEVVKAKDIQDALKNGTQMKRDLEDARRNLGNNEIANIEITITKLTEERNLKNS